MLILLYLFLAKVVLPKLGASAQALLGPVMVIVITMAGIVMLFGAVGLKISNNLASTVVGGIFQAIGYICKQIIKAIGWIASIICKMIKRAFNESRRCFRQMGLKDCLSNLLAIAVVFMILIIII